MAVTQNKHLTEFWIFLYHDWVCSLLLGQHIASYLILRLHDWIWYVADETELVFFKRKDQYHMSISWPRVLPDSKGYSAIGKRVIEDVCLQMLLLRAGMPRSPARPVDSNTSFWQSLGA